MRPLLTAMAALVSGVVVGASAPRRRARVCDVTARGAVGDGVADDTKAIRAALAECVEVLLPAGRTFLTGPLNLTDDQTLRIDGVLLAAPAHMLDAYPVVAPLPSYGWSRDVNCFDKKRRPHGIVVGVSDFSPVIGAFGRRNVSVVGKGTIDGQGRGWWDRCAAHALPQGRPRVVEMHTCIGVLVQGLSIRDPPFWTVHVVYSSAVRVVGLTIEAPVTQGNTDGVDIDSSSDVVVEDCVIHNGDDGVAIKSGKDHFGIAYGRPTRDVLVRNVTVARGSRGGFAIGSEMSGGVENVTVADSAFVGQYGFFIKSCPGRGGYIRDIVFRNIELESGILLTLAYEGDDPRGPVPAISNLLFDGVRGRGGCTFDGCEKAAGGECFNMSFRQFAVAGCSPPTAFSEAYV